MRYEGRCARERRRNDPRKEQEPKWLSRLTGQLLAALAAAALWVAVTSGFPETASYWRARTRELVGQSWDLSGAFSELGQQLQSGQDPIASVEEWCVSVFLPAEVTVSQSDEG